MWEIGIAALQVAVNIGDHKIIMSETWSSPRRKLNDLFTSSFHVCILLERSREGF
jgi:hypothetical protein